MVRSKLYAPISYIAAKELNDRIDIVQKLKDLGVAVLGAEMKDEHGKWLVDTSQLRDILQKEEYLRDHPEAKSDVPEADPEMAKQALREYARYKERKGDGRKLFY